MTSPSDAAPAGEPTDPVEPSEATSELPSSPFGGGALSVLDKIDRDLTELAEVSWWAVGDADLLKQTIRLETLRRKVEAARLAAVAEVHNRNLGVQAGAKSTVGWLVEKTRIGRGDARAVVQTASRLGEHSSKVRAALAAGTISVGHAVAIAATLNELFERSIRADSPVTHEVRAEAEKTLLGLAATLDPAQLASVGAVLIERVDPDHDPFPEHAPLRDQARRAFSRTVQPDGFVKFAGELDPEGWAVVDAALSPLSAPRPETAEGKDRRSATQRRGDALVDLAQLALTAGTLGSEAGGTGATVFVGCDHETLERKLTEDRPTLDTGTPITPETLRRLACDAMIIAAVLGSSSQPLDIGRATRTVPAGMRRALLARDKHCAFPGCSVAPAWCHAHHCSFWADGGPTALWNLVLLCPHHHRLIHHSDWDVEIGPDGLPTFTPPAWLSPDIAAKDPTWRIALAERFPRRPSAA